MADRAGTSRPKQGRGRRTAKRVVDAAEACISPPDPIALSIEVLSAASQVSVGSIYHHFGSLDGVAAALYQRCMAALLDHILGELEGAVGAEGGVRSVVVAYLDWTRCNPARARFIHASAYADFIPSFAEAIQAAKAPQLERMFAWFAPYIASGEIVALPPSLYEILLIGPAAEVARRWLTGLPMIYLEEAMEALPERVWASLRP